MAAHTEETLKPGLPTLHHMNHSQSQRIVWLLEELNIEYNLALHFRDAKTHRAPPELKTLHPMGKAPILVTADGITIAESSAIATYLLKTYDAEGRFATRDWILDEQLLSFAGSTLGPNATVELVFDVMVKMSPWPITYLMKGIKSQIDKGLTGPEFKNEMSYLEGLLVDEKGPWFNGEKIGRADFLLSWPFDVLAQRKYVDFNDYPKIKAWRERVLARDAWKRGLTKGNGYDLTTW